MNFKPADFFLGIVDFLGVLVPGAVLAYLLDDRLCHIYRISPLHVHWLAFAAVSYLFGHLLLALTESFNWLAGRVLHVLHSFSKTQQDAMKLQKDCRHRLGTAAGENPGTTFHAALSLLRLKNADAAAEVDRHMAGYKLLRNLVAVFLIDFVLTLFGTHETSANVLTSQIRHYRLLADAVLSLLFFLAFLRMLQWAKLLAFQYCVLIYDQVPNQKQRD